MSLMGLIAISGIFGSKNEDLDILPPPPPFPDIMGSKRSEDAAEEEWKRGKQKREEVEKQKKSDGIKEKNKANIIGRLLKRKEEGLKESQIPSISEVEKIETPEIMPRTFEKIDHVQEIEERVHKARMALMDFKFGDAKKAYMEIMRLYNSISQKDRHKVYEDIKDLYYERKSAEKFAKV